MITAFFAGEKIASNSQAAFSLQDTSSFGEKKGQRVEYAAVEALYLVSEKKMHVTAAKKTLDFESLLKRLKKHDKRIETKFAVFQDLRKKGYIVKTALKYGADFRVYDKGMQPGDEHARWILYATREHDHLQWHDFAAKNRVAHSTKKNLLIAIVDEEGDVSYYEVSWLRP